MRVGSRISLFLGLAAIASLFLIYSPSNRDTLRSILVPSSETRYPPPIVDLDPGWDDLEPLPSDYDTILPHGIPSIFQTPKLRPLGLKLDAFLRRPILTRDEAQTQNIEQCPKNIADPLVNQDQYRGESNFWDGITKEDIVKRRVEIVRELQKRVLQDETVVAEDVASEKRRGIVLTAGNKDTVDRAVFLLKHLKRLRVNLPVEVFHYPGELEDIIQRNQIEQLGAIIRMVSGVKREEHLWKNFQIKGLAIVQSSFQEVLYLDSDNAPIRDPTHLFDSPLYTEHGRAVFWPDLYKDHPSNAIWRLVGEQCTLDKWTFESGQFIVDKAGNEGLNYAALLIVAFMQSHHDFWFHMCGGDKDTFRWAFQILDLPWTHPSIWMSSLGFLNDWDGGRFCGHSIVQYDLVKPLGQDRELPLFVHSNLLKHMLTNGLIQGQVFTHVVLQKRPLNDTYTSSALNHFRMDVYQGVVRGLCVDLHLQDSATSLSSADQAGLQIQTIRVEDIDGKPFRGFEDAFWAEGGRLEGW